VPEETKTRTLEIYIGSSMTYDCRPEETGEHHVLQTGPEVHFLYTETALEKEIFFNFHVVM